MIVAVEPDQLPRLDVLYDRGLQNEVPDLRMVGPDEISQIEPNCVVGFLVVCCVLNVLTFEWPYNSDRFLVCTLHVTMTAQVHNIFWLTAVVNTLL